MFYSLKGGQLKFFYAALLPGGLIKTIDQKKVAKIVRQKHDLYIYVYAKCVYISWFVLCGLEHTLYF